MLVVIDFSMFYMLSYNVIEWCDINKPLIFNKYVMDNACGTGNL